MPRVPVKTLAALQARMDKFQSTIGAALEATQAEIAKLEEQYSEHMRAARVLERRMAKLQGRKQEPGQPRAIRETRGETWPAARRAMLALGAVKPKSAHLTDIAARMLKDGYVYSGKDPSRLRDVVYQALKGRMGAEVGHGDEPAHYYLMKGMTHE